MARRRKSFVVCTVPAGHMLLTLFPPTISIDGVLKDWDYLAEKWVDHDHARATDLGYGTHD